jgi:hypothetical protein
MRDRVYGWQWTRSTQIRAPVGEGASEPSNAVSVRNLMPADRPDGGDSQKLQQCPVSRLAIARPRLGRALCVAGRRRSASPMRPRTLGHRVSDQFTVPVCLHHRELHRLGDEVAWWVSSPSILYRSRSSYGSTRGSMARPSRSVEAPSLGLQSQR